jgi:hypothetical protein
VIAMGFAFMWAEIPTIDEYEKYKNDLLTSKESLKYGVTPFAYLEEAVDMIDEANKSAEIDLMLENRLSKKHKAGIIAPMVVKAVRTTSNVKKSEEKLKDELKEIFRYEADLQYINAAQLTTSIKKIAELYSKMKGYNVNTKQTIRDLLKQIRAGKQ